MTMLLEITQELDEETQVSPYSQPLFRCTIELLQVLQQQKDRVQALLSAKQQQALDSRNKVENMRDRQVYNRKYVFTVRRITPFCLQPVGSGRSSDTGQGHA